MEAKTKENEAYRQVLLAEMKQRTDEAQENAKHQMKKYVKKLKALEESGLKMQKNMEEEKERMQNEIEEKYKTELENEREKAKLLIEKESSKCIIL